MAIPWSLYQSYSLIGVDAAGFDGLIVRQSYLYRDTGCATLITQWPVTAYLAVIHMASLFAQLFCLRV